MSAKIIISSDIPQRREGIVKSLSENGLSENHPDLLIFEDGEKLGVETVKKVKEFLSFKPYQASGKGVAIISAQDLTPDAQNSLLKILEEPPESATILLGADNDKKLLDTVLSRCQIITLNALKGIYPSPTSQDDRYKNDIERLMNSNIDERFAYIEKLEEREEFLDAMVTFFSKKLTEDPKYLRFSKELMEAQKYKEANGNLRAILEYLMLML